MEEVLVRTKAKDSSTIVGSAVSGNFQTFFTPPLYRNGRDYELVMVNLEMHYSFANIRADNNSLKSSGDAGKTWTALHIPTGCYELKAINPEIIRMLGGNSDIFFFFLCIFVQDDDNPRRVNSFRSTAWTGQTFTTHTTLNTEQNQLAIKVSADN